MADAGTVELIDVPEPSGDLQPGQAILQLIAGGVCGSDMPRFRVVAPRPDGGFGGAPIHEVTARVVATDSPRLTVGQRVVGTQPDGVLQELFVASDRNFIEVPPALSDIEAVSVQSLSTVLRVAEHVLPDVAGRRVAVIGAGPIGLAFCHVLKSRGAYHVVAVDRVDRSAEAAGFGVDEFVRLPASAWVATLPTRERPHVVIEAVGHQDVAVADALRAVADGGYVYGFGSPDDEQIVFPYRLLYQKSLTLAAGRTTDGWLDVLDAGCRYLLDNRDAFCGYVTHVLPYRAAQRAYDLYARPQRGRLKVAITADDGDNH